jgi:hypothetical protein
MAQNSSIIQRPMATANPVADRAMLALHENDIRLNNKIDESVEVISETNEATADDLQTQIDTNAANISSNDTDIQGLQEQKKQSTRQYQIDGDFNFWDEYTAPVTANGYFSNMWKLNIGGSSASVTKIASSINSKTYAAQFVSNGAGTNTRIEQIVNGNVFSNKSLSVFVLAKHNGTNPSNLLIELLSSGEPQVNTAMTFDSSFTWKRYDLTVGTHAGGDGFIRIIARTAEAFDITFEKIRVIETQGLPTGIIPDWVKEDEKPEITRIEVLQYFERKGIGSGNITGLCSGFVFDATNIFANIEYSKKISSPTISSFSNIQARTATQTLAISAIATVSSSENCAWIGFIVSGATPSGTPAIIRKASTVNAYIDINARY